MTARVGRPVIVIGSANVDVSVRASAIPGPGETLFVDGAELGLGGKGANQAVSAAACNAPTRLVARIGDDAFGRMVTDGLSARGVNIADIRRIPDMTTGMAVIYVEAGGQNRIAVAPGANACLMAEDVDAIAASIGKDAILVLQCEIPMESLYRALELAGRVGCEAILNPAPYRGLDLKRLQGQVTYLVVNEVEASQMSGANVESVADAERCATALQARGFACVIVTLGHRGCVVADGKSVRHVAAHLVSAVDTTGAGDAFVGCLAGSLATDWSRDDSIARANLYAALTTTQRGAQPPVTLQRELDRVWSER